MPTVPTASPIPEQIEAFLALIGPQRTARLCEAAGALSDRLGPGTLWHINSTSVGGGVAEILHFLVPLYRYLGVRVGWMVIEGDEAFFVATKRLGNLAYGSDEPDDRLRDADRATYRATSEANAEQVRGLLSPKDVVLLHDHQTAGMATTVAETGAAVHWRCHIGTDTPTRGSAEAWSFLAPLLAPVSGVVFSLPQHVPDELSMHRSTIIPPVLWPFSAKNLTLPEPVVRRHLERCKLVSGREGVTAPVDVVGAGPPDPGTPLVVQVSRWDRLKDMHGVLRGFGSVDLDAHLVLLGPDPSAIPDDREQHRWFRTCLDAWQDLPAERQHRVSLVRLPMSDSQDNAQLVNAAQRAATVVVQKSLAEGFGLTVAEAMWKGRTVIGSAVGGITEQIQHQHNGLLLEDPHDLTGFGTLVKSTVDGDVDHDALGRRARHDVHEHLLPDRDVLGTAQLLGCAATTTNGG